MDTLELIGSTMGLGFLAGIRLYATVFALGMVIRMGWFHPGANEAGLMILAHPAVLAVAGVACLLEFFADKVPWIDSAWDSFHTIIRPIGAILLASASLSHLDPVVKASLMILCGGVALATTGSKASTRLAVNHSPEPFSNITLSLIEDAIIPVGMWISLKHPEIALIFVSFFLAFALWLAPKIFRAVRLRWVALNLWIASSGRHNATALSDPLQTIAAHAENLPSRYAQSAQKILGAGDAPTGVRAAATSSVDGMSNSLGYLAVGNDGLVFVTRRWFRNRTHVLPFSSISTTELRRGILTHRLVVTTPDGVKAFHIFRNVQVASNAEAGQPVLRNV